MAHHFWHDNDSTSPFRLKVWCAVKSSIPETLYRVLPKPIQTEWWMSKHPASRGEGKNGLPPRSALSRSSLEFTRPMSSSVSPPEQKLWDASVNHQTFDRTRKSCWPWNLVLRLPAMNVRWILIDLWKYERDWSFKESAKPKISKTFKNNENGAWSLKYTSQSLVCLEQHTEYLPNARKPQPQHPVTSTDFAALQQTLH